MLGNCGPRYLTAALGFVALACVAFDGAVWLWSVSRLEGMLQHRISNLRDAGWEIPPVSAHYSGWPARAVVRAGPSSIGAYGYSLHSAALVVEAPLLRPTPLTLQIVGAKLPYDAGPGSFVEAENVSATVHGDKVSVSGEHLHIASFAAGGSFRLELSANSLSLTIARLRLLDHGNATDAAIDEIEFKAEPLSSIPKADSLRSALLLWREADGSLKLTLSRLSGNGMVAAGYANLRLDAALQPALDGVVNLVGYSASLDALAAAGLITAGSAAAAKAVLGLLTQASHTEVATIPIRIAAGIVYVANFGLMRLPTLEWPGLASTQ